MQNSTYAPPLFNRAKPSLLGFAHDHKAQKCTITLE
jgi:hypothetical protein